MLKCQNLQLPSILVETLAGPGVFWVEVVDHLPFPVLLLTCGDLHEVGTDFLFGACG